ISCGWVSLVRKGFSVEQRLDLLIKSQLLSKSKIGRRAAFGLALLDEGVEFFADGGVHRRLLVACQPLLPHPVGALQRRRRAGFRPGLEIAPVGSDRRVEAGLVARLRVRCAEEMPARADVADGVDGE